MAMSADDMAKAVHKALGQPASTAISPQAKGLTKSIVDEIKEGGKVAHALVTGTTAAGSPLAAGAAANGTVTGLVAASLAGRFVANGVAPSVTKETKDYAAAFVKHMLTAQVLFPPGKITGSATSSSSSPGPLAAAQGKQGQVLGLDGDALAALIGASRGGVSATLKAECGAIVKHITDACEATYLPGDVKGTCPPGGGPLASGVATGGKLS
jgi:hypothetical protein